MNNLPIGEINIILTLSGALDNEGQPSFFHLLHFSSYFNIDLMCWTNLSPSGGVSDNIEYILFVVSRIQNLRGSDNT